MLLSNAVMPDPMPPALSDNGSFVFTIIRRAIRALHHWFCRFVQIEGRIDQRDMR